jgi:hypothetical protein
MNVVPLPGLPVCSRNDGVPEFRKPAVGEVAEVMEEAPIGTVLYQVEYRS